MNKKLIRITTVPLALRYLLPGQMKFMHQNGFDVVMISADGEELNEVIQNEQCRHIIVPMTRKITPLQDAKCLIKLIKIFRKEKPDIVHTHTPKAGLLGMLAAKFCRVKIRIHTVAGLPLMVEKGFKLKLLTAIEKLTYKAATQVWPNSNSLLQIIKNKKLTVEKKLKVIGNGSTNGVDTGKFSRENLSETQLDEIRKSINYSTDNIYLLCIGRLVADKGIPELVDVFLSLQKQNPNLKLVLVGRYEKNLDPLPDETYHLITQHPAIIHINWSNHVEYYMATADYFVFPSHREGFPNVLLQAGAMQLPVICSRIEGNIDIIEHEKTGLIFESGNTDQMRQLIIYALSNSDRMTNMAQALGDIILKKFRKENMWQALFEEYKSLIADTA